MRFASILAISLLIGGFSSTPGLGQTLLLSLSFVDSVPALPVTVNVSLSGSAEVPWAERFLNYSARRGVSQCIKLS